MSVILRGERECQCPRLGEGRRLESCLFLQASLPPISASHRPRQPRASPKCPESCFRLRCSLSRSESSCFLWAWMELHVSDILVPQLEQVLESRAADQDLPARVPGNSQFSRGRPPANRKEIPGNALGGNVISGVALALKLTNEPSYVLAG